LDKHPEVLHNAEPFYLPGNETGCLLIHGYTGTPFEMKMLARSLQAEGYTVYAPRLFGHATDPEDMLRARWWDWVGNVEDALALLKATTQRQIIMGLSMGGALALLASARYPVEAVISLSTPYALPPDRRIALLKHFSWVFPRISKGQPDWHNAQAGQDHIDYPYFPSRSILELKLLLDTLRAEISNVTVPAFFAQSRQDTTILPESLDYLYTHVSSSHKDKLWVENSGHVIIREPQRELVFSQVKSFLTQVLNPA
jgi:carboxylesterase